jgi:hypothetical protein
VHVARANPKSYKKERERRNGTEHRPSQHHRLSIGLLGPVNDFVRLGAGKHDVPLQLAAECRHPLIEFCRNELPGTRLDLSNGFLKVTQADMDSFDEFIGRMFEDKAVQQDDSQGRIVRIQPDAVLRCQLADNLLNIDFWHKLLRLREGRAFELFEQIAANNVEAGSLGEHEIRRVDGLLEGHFTFAHPTDGLTKSIGTPLRYSH